MGCGGSGVVEMPGEQVARGCPEAIAELVFPGIKTQDGLMLRRTMGLTRLEMLEYRESLEALLGRVNACVETGDWPATLSDPGCAECPCKPACPIPRELRDYRGTINTVDEARVALERRYVERLQSLALGREIKAFAKAQGGAPIRYGRDRVAEFVVREATAISDRDAMFAALAAGVELDEVKAAFVRTSTGTSFAERELTDDELQEAVNGRE